MLIMIWATNLAIFFTWNQESLP